MGFRRAVLSQSIILFPSMSDFVISVSKSYRQDPTKMSIDFKGSHYPKDVILYAVFFYVRYGVGPVALSFRSECSFKRQSFRKPRGFSNLVPSVCAGDCRSR